MLHPVYKEMHQMESGKEELQKKLKACEDEEEAEKVLDEIELLLLIVWRLIGVGEVNQIGDLILQIGLINAAIICLLKASG